MSANYLIATSLLRHPKEFSKLVAGENNRAAAAFKQLGTVRAMKNYVLQPFEEGGPTSQNLARKAEKAVTKAFVESPSESGDESENAQGSQASPKRTRTEKEKATTSRSIIKPKLQDDDDDDDTSSDEEESLTKPTTTKRRTPVRQLVDELESEIHTPKKRKSK